uniref:Uncharacterized protein n=1 Tax=Oryza nivara TaxID=4536 RepID=A0A0E0FZD7_ORYNI
MSYYTSSIPVNCITTPSPNWKEIMAILSRSSCRTLARSPKYLFLPPCNANFLQMPDSKLVSLPDDRADMEISFKPLQVKLVHVVGEEPVDIRATIPRARLAGQGAPTARQLGSAHLLAVPPNLQAARPIL